MKFDRSKRNKILCGLTLAMRLGLGCLFLWSSLPKIRQPYDFLSNVYEYELVGPKLGMLSAMVVPWLELILGICLLGGIFVGGATMIAIGLMVFFTFAHASVLYRGLDISCGCFSTSGSDLISYGSLLRNCFLLIACILAYLGLSIRYASNSNY